MYTDRSITLAVVTIDGKEIRDNVRHLCHPTYYTTKPYPFIQMLHKWLVKPLPSGSALTAIFDSCNSGTLLGNVPSILSLSTVAYIRKDLGHYKCNNVYRPWVNKGKRRSKTLQNCAGTSGIAHPSSLITLFLRAVRKNCKGTGSGPQSRHNSRHNSRSWIGSGEADAQFPSLIQVIRDKCPTTEPEQMAKESDNHHGERCASPEPEEHDRESRALLQRTRHDGERCLSPERKFKCEGWCRDKNKVPRMTTFDHPDVVRWVFNHFSIPPYLLPRFS